MKRVKSGIEGLDLLIDGGFLEGHSILVCGHPGTGKTVLSLQFLWEGIKNSTENGLYVSIEDHLPKLKFYASQFGWDFEKAVKMKKMNFLEIPIDQRGFKIVDAIQEAAKEVGAKRIAIDSLSALNVNARMFDLPLKDQMDPTGTIKGRVLKVAGYTPFENLEQFTYLFIDRVVDIEATTLFITDAPSGQEALTKDGVSEYVCDGVIQMQLHDTSRNVSRTLAVKKMRGTPIIPGMNSLKFTPAGLEVGEYKAFY